MAEEVLKSVQNLQLQEQGTEGDPRLKERKLCIYSIIGNIFDCLQNIVERGCRDSPLYAIAPSITLFK